MSTSGSARITLPGVPVAQARARWSRRTGRMYTPEPSRQYKYSTQQFIALQWDIAPLEGPVILYVDVFREIPASWSARHKENARAQRVMPITKPDLDNYVKAIKDAMTGIVYRDDAQVVTEHSTKRYSDDPRVVVTVGWGDA